MNANRARQLVKAVRANNRSRAPLTTVLIETIDHDIEQAAKQGHEWVKFPRLLNEFELNFVRQHYLPRGFVIHQEAVSWQEF